MAKKRQLPLKIDKYDSDFFNKRIARLNIPCERLCNDFSGKLRDLIELAKKEKVRFLVIKLYKPMALYERALKVLGFKDYGKSVDFKLRLKKSYKIPVCKEIEIRPLKRKEKDSAISIGRDAFRLSYFYACAFARTKRIDDYHARWVENLIKDKGVEVFAALKGDDIVGFNAVSFDKQKKQARIILITVDKRYRGLGIGKKLMHGSIYNLKDRFNEIFVKTQEKNSKAISLYKAAGFKLKSKDKIFCKKL